MLSRGSPQNNIRVSVYPSPEEKTFSPWGEGRPKGWLSLKSIKLVNSATSGLFKMAAISNGFSHQRKREKGRARSFVVKIFL